MKTEDFLDDVRCELGEARHKFPAQSPEHTLIALQEEVGELSQAYLHIYKERKNKTYKELYKEAVQVAVMAARVVLDCGLE